MPEGGPPDTIPPEVISVYPAPNTINFSDNKIVLEFSEYVDRRSVEEALFFSPAIRDVEFDWSGTEVSIIFQEALRKNTTYVATLGTDVKDFRNGNRMASSFTIAFSTGEKIDKGIISGTVFDEKPDGIMIFSYRMNDILADTLNPVHTHPDYITQTGKTGKFTLTNLADGTYRLFAVRDEYRNLLYDPEVDDAGTTNDVLLSAADTMKSGIQFILAKEDTTPPRIVSIQALDNKHISVTLSESLDSLSVKKESFRISDTLGTVELPIKTFFPGSEQYTQFTLVTDKQKDKETYLLSIAGVKDLSGYEINPLAKQKLFTGSNLADTIPPRIALNTVKDSMAMFFSDDSITLQFTDAVRIEKVDSAFGVIKRNDSSFIGLNAIQKNPAKYILKPLSALGINQKYSLKIRWKFIEDLFGHHEKDSTTYFPFTIIDPEQFGNIDGSFAGFGKKSPMMIQAENIANKNQLPKMIHISSFGKFSIVRLPEGQYVLKAFSDDNNNQRHDAGKIFPYHCGEQFKYYPDTLRVRARWPVDGVFFK